jgi:A/G-specific adenine glycosylase
MELIQRLALGFHTFVPISPHLSTEIDRLSTGPPGIIAHMTSPIAKALLNWYRAGHRALPWRGERNPYRIWISEIMLQQTQVDTAIPYYRRWLRRFPTLRSLAAAPEREVLALWEGLGYYSRARNLHRAAQIVMTQYEGRLPNTVDGLRALPGIGPYTAAAIASLAFGVDAAVLDGNVKRVLARVFNFQEVVKSPRGEKQLWERARSLLPTGHAGDYNQAIMDLGATICSPRAPQCPRCPIRKHCLARQLGVQLQRPVPRQKAPLPQHTRVVAVIRKRGRVLLVQRPRDQLLGGLWAFPSGELVEGRSPVSSLKRAIKRDWRLAIEIQTPTPTQTLTHTFSHFRLTAQVYACAWRGGALRRGTQAKWVRVAELSDYPMGKVDRQIARAVPGRAKAG